MGAASSVSGSASSTPRSSNASSSSAGNSRPSSGASSRSSGSRQSTDGSTKQNGKFSFGSLFNKLKKVPSNPDNRRKFEWEEWQWETPRSREYSRQGPRPGKSAPPDNVQQLIEDLPHFTNSELLLPEEEVYFDLGGDEISLDGLSVGSGSRPGSGRSSSSKKFRPSGSSFVEATTTLKGDDAHDSRGGQRKQRYSAQPEKNPIVSSASSKRGDRPVEGHPSIDSRDDVVGGKAITRTTSVDTVRMLDGEDIPAMQPRKETEVAKDAPGISRQDPTISVPLPSTEYQMERTLSLQLRDDDEVEDGINASQLPGGYSISKLAADDDSKAGSEDRERRSSRPGSAQFTARSAVSHAVSVVSQPDSETAIETQLQHMKDMQQRRMVHGRMDFSRRNLHSVPMQVYHESTDGPNALRELWVQYNQIQWVPEVIGRVTSLTSLKLHDNIVQRIPSEIGLLTNLTGLYLHNNRLKEVPECVRYLQKLKLLTLSNNLITMLPSCMGDLTSLGDLVLDGLKLDAPPKEVLVRGPQKVVEYLAGLEEAWTSNILKITHAGLLTAPLDIMQMETLTRLDLSNNKISDVPANFLSELLDLDLSFNRFHTVPEGIWAYMTSLTVLNMNENPLHSVPLAVAGLESLKVFDITVSQGLNNPPRCVVLKHAQLRYLKTVRDAERTREVDLRRMGLPALPKIIAEEWDLNPELINVTTLRLSGNEITDVYTGIPHWTNLTSLDLEGNKLTDLPREVFMLTNLTELLMSRNLLTELPQEFSEMKLLNRLLLDANRFKQFPPCVLEMSTLTTLSMCENRLKDIPSALKTLQNMRKLHLSSNLIRHFPEGALSMPLLRSFHISHNSIDGNIPPQISRWEMMEDLRLNDNKFASFPVEAGVLYGMRTLDLSGTKIGVIPACITNYTSLKKLSISGCPITNLPLSLGSLTALRRLEFDIDAAWKSPPASVMSQGSEAALAFLQAFEASRKSGDLNLSELHMAGLPLEVFALTSLTVLNIQRNNFTHIPTAISKLTSLTSLSITNNPILVLPLELCMCSKIANLKLGIKPSVVVPVWEILQQGPSIILRYLRRMFDARTSDHLDISSLNLSRIPPEVVVRSHDFHAMVNLTSLDASHNNIKMITSAINCLQQLITLDLSYNQLHTMPPQIANITSLQSINLSNNPLQNLPGEMGFPDSLTDINISNCPDLRIPLEVAPDTQGLKQMLRTVMASKTSGVVDWSSLGMIVPPSTCVDIPHAKEINMQRNRLAILGSGFGPVVKLQHLRLEFNQISRINLEFMKMTSVRFLNLDDNSLSAVPPEVYTLPCLEVLTLARNHLDSSCVPNKILTPCRLKALVLDENGLGKLNDGVGDMPHLQALSLECNSLNSLPEDLKFCTAMTELRLDDNRMGFIPPCVSSLKKLVRFRAPHNQISVVPAWLGRLTNLEALSLRDNGLRALPSSFVYLTLLTSLELSGNHLDTLPPSVLEMGAKEVRKYLQYNTPYEAVAEDR